MTQAIGRRRILVLLTVSAWAGIMIWVAVKTGIQHDHRWYIQEWNRLQQSGRPYEVINPYGIIHQIFYVFLSEYHLTPKLLFVQIYSLSLIAYVFFSVSKWGVNSFLLLVFTILANFLVICFVAIYGLNDSLVAALVFSSILAKQRNLSSISGIFLGIATLVKFYPLFIVVFFSLHRRKWDIVLLKYSLSTIVLGNLLCLFFWGENYLTSILFSVGRSSSLLSPLESLKALSWNETFEGPIWNALFSLNQFLILTNIVFVALAILVSVYLANRWNLTWLQFAAIGYVFVLSVYKVGHPQLYLAWLSILIALVLDSTTNGVGLYRHLFPIVFFFANLPIWFLPY